MRQLHSPWPRPVGAALVLIGLGCAGLPSLSKKEVATPPPALAEPVAASVAAAPPPAGPAPIIHTVDVGPAATEDRRVTVWLSQLPKATEGAPTAERNFGPLPSLKVDSWVFAKDGRYALAVSDQDVLLLDIAAATTKALPKLPDRAAIGFLADARIAGVAYTGVGLCEGTVRACLLLDDAWSCDDAAPVGGWREPGCDPPAWAGEPKFTSVERGPAVSKCDVGSDAPAPDPVIAAAFKPPSGDAQWRITAGPTPWAYQEAEGDCGAVPEYPVFVWNRQTWVPVQTSAPAGAALHFEQSGPWLLLYGAEKNTVYNLASADPAQPVTDLWQGTIWPDEIPIPGATALEATAATPAPLVAPVGTASSTAKPAAAPAHASPVTGTPWSGEPQTAQAPTASTASTATTTVTTTTSTGTSSTRSSSSRSSARATGQTRVGAAEEAPSGSEATSTRSSTTNSMIRPHTKKDPAKEGP